MTSTSQLPMDFPWRPNRDSRPGVWLGLCITHRELFDALQDEWLEPRNGAFGHVLGVNRFAVRGDLEHEGNLIATYLQVAPHELPSLQLLAKRQGQWRRCTVREINTSDEAVFWPGLLPTFAISSVLVNRQEEAARLVGMASAVSNILLPSIVDRLRGDEAVTQLEEPEDANTLARLVLPTAVDSIRGATAMAFWAVPRIAPWLDLLLASLDPAKQPLQRLASQLDAPFWAYPPWFGAKFAAAEDGLATSQTRLWLAAIDVFQASSANPAEQSAADIARAIYDKARGSELGTDSGGLASWLAQTVRILRGDSTIQASQDGESQVGTAIQMVLTRPHPSLFRSWLDDLPGLSPAVWWSAAVLCGLQCGYRQLDVKFRQKDSAIRRYFASHALFVINPIEPIVGALDSRSMALTWRAESGHVICNWDGLDFPIGAEQSRGKWYLASLADATLQRAAVVLARQLRWPCFRRDVVLADSDLLVDGTGQVSAVGGPVRQISITGQVRLSLPSAAVVEETLDENLFRHLIATAGCPALPLPPSPAVPHPTLVSPVVKVAEQRLSVAGRPETGTARIPGLLYVADFLSESEERDLLATIDALPWLSDLSRRVQHYGFRYAYKARKVDASMWLGPLPPWAAQLAARLQAEKRLPHLANQVIVNEYVGKQGIAKHIDCEPCFSDGIAMISLGESWEMIFAQPGTSGRRVPLLLERRSLAVLTGEARYLWTHEIPKRQTEPTGASRGRRVSVTFRHVEVSESAKPHRGRRGRNPPEAAPSN